jgi:IS605 OrfB family transposase
MIRTIPLNLKVTKDQSTGLKELQVRFSKACSLVSSIAKENKEKNKVKLHHLSYYPVREQIPEIGSDMVDRAIQRVCGAYSALFAREPKLRKDEWPSLSYKTNSSIDYSDCCYRILTKEDTVSLFVSKDTGRIKVPFLLGKVQSQTLRTGKIKQATLISKGKKWYLNVCVELTDPPVVQGTTVLGVDIGENNLAVTSNGTIYSGGKLKYDRDRYLAYRSRLQSNGSKSAKRRLKRASGREARHVQNINHVVSKAIVSEAKEKECAYIVLEDLTGIRKAIRASRRVRTRLNRWSFNQLRTFIEYKAQGSGIQVIYIDPSYTSITCSSCGSIGIRNKHTFSCPICGRLAHSDRNAAQNIANLGTSVVVPTRSFNAGNAVALTG